MSILDRIVAAVTPPESDEDRIEARQMAEQYVDRAPWLSLVLDHHRQIDAAFEKVKMCTDAAGKRQALRDLGELLTAHSIAEEAVIYPSLSDVGDTGHATMAYTEQSAAKMQIGLLEKMDPMSRDFDDKFGHLEGAVKHHVYQEEGNWFRQLADAANEADHTMIAERYREEFERYMNGGSASHRAGEGGLMFSENQNSAGTGSTYVAGGDQVQASGQYDDGLLGSDTPETSSSTFSSDSDRNF
jgi:hemerythrin superfamily protein